MLWKGLEDKARVGEGCERKEGEVCRTEMEERRDGKEERKGRGGGRGRERKCLNSGLQRHSTWVSDSM